MGFLEPTDRRAIQSNRRFGGREPRAGERSMMSQPGSATAVMWAGQHHLLFVDTERARAIRLATSECATTCHASNYPCLVDNLNQTVWTHLVLGTDLLSDWMITPLTMGRRSYRLVIDAATTALGLGVVWEILRKAPAAILPRDSLYDLRVVARVFGPEPSAPDELIRAWAPLVSRLPIGLSRAILEATCGAR